MKKVKKCISCGANPKDFETLLSTRAIHRGLFFKKKFDIECCRKCGLVFLSPLPTMKEYDTFYSEQYWADYTLEHIEKMSEANIKTYAPFYEKWSKDIKKSDKYLDLGGGWGGFTIPLIKNKTLSKKQVHFNEPSTRATAFVTENFGITQHEPNLFEQNSYEKNYFDYVLASAIIEHFHNPYDAMLEMNRVICKGGKLVMFTPNIDAPVLLRGLYRYFKVPHPYYFSVGNLISIAKRSGFKVVDQHISPNTIENKHFIEPQYRSGMIMLYLEKTQNVTKKKPAPKTVRAAQKDYASHINFYQYFYYPLYFIKNTFFKR